MEAPKAANDTIAHQIAQCVIDADVGSSQCAILLTRPINGQRFYIMSEESFVEQMGVSRCKGERAALASAGVK